MCAPAFRPIGPGPPNVSRNGRRGDPCDRSVLVLLTVRIPRFVIVRESANTRFAPTGLLQSGRAIILLMEQDLLPIICQDLEMKTSRLYRFVFLFFFRRALRRTISIGSFSNAIDWTTRSRRVFRCTAATFSGVLCRFCHFFNLMFNSTRSTELWLRGSMKIIIPCLGQRDKGLYY